MNEQICPRCGKAVVEVKDFGKSGKLFVHVYFEEAGMQHQDAHRVSVAELANGLTWTRKA
jgi:hypothetical protein